MNHSDRAGQILNKIKRDRAKRAVLKQSDGSFRTCKVDGLFEERINELQQIVVGVYDQSCPLEWLEADLRWASRHL